MRHLYALLLAALASTAQADPFVYADPYPASIQQPAGVVFTINGGDRITCEAVRPADGSLLPKCDLGSITEPGTYILVMTVTWPYRCINSANGAECTEAGEASSAPFLFKRIASNVPIQGLRVGP